MPTGTGFARDRGHESLRIVWSSAHGRCRVVPASSLCVRRRLGRRESHHVRLLPPEESAAAPGANRARRRVLGAHRGSCLTRRGGFAPLPTLRARCRSLVAASPQRRIARAKPALGSSYLDTLRAITEV